MRKKIYYFLTQEKNHSSPVPEYEIIADNLMFLIPQNLWEVRKTEDRGRGVYALGEINPGTVIGDYLGRIIPYDDFDEQHDGLYDMWYSDDLCILPDPSGVGIHLMNHSCAPNCAIYPYRDRMLFFALRRIFPGEEFTVSYLIDPPLDTEPPHRHTCYCKTPVCHGTMDTTWEFSQKWSAYIDELKHDADNPPPHRAGDTLKHLSRYPDTIDDNPIYDLFGSWSHQPVDFAAQSMPDAQTVRRHIRQNGVGMRIPQLQTVILGVMNGLIVSR